MTKAKFVVVRDGYYDEADVFETLAEVRDYLQERNDEDPDYFTNISGEFNIYAIGERIPFNFIPATISIDTATQIATPGTLPAPLENETVGAYARRISGGN